MDIKQLAEQKLAQERVLQEEQQRQDTEWQAKWQASETERRQLEDAYSKIGGDKNDTMQTDPSLEQQTLIKEFISIVPTQCWEIDCRKYMGFDGMMRIVPRYISKARAANLLGFHANVHHSDEQEKQIRTQEAKFPRHGSQLSVSKDLVVFQDGSAFCSESFYFSVFINYEELQSFLVNWLADLMRTA